MDVIILQMIDLRISYIDRYHILEYIFIYLFPYSINNNFMQSWNMFLYISNILL